MKKLSTKTIRGIGKLQEGHLTVGLDLGDRSSFYCVLNGAGEVIVEEKVTTSPEAMKKTFGKMPRSRIALETGRHSPWVSRLLSDLGHEAIVAHARNVRLIEYPKPRASFSCDRMVIRRSLVARNAPGLYCRLPITRGFAESPIPTYPDRRSVRSNTETVCAGL